MLTLARLNASLGAAAAFLSLAAPVSAGNNININLVPNSGPATNIANITAPGLVATTINLIIGGTGIMSLIMLLWGGFSWVTAGGDKDALDKARKKVTGALIGLALTLSVYAFLRVIQILFGLNLLTVTINRIQ